MGVAGVVAGMTLLAAAPAHAVTCDVTLDAGSATAADIQTALSDPTKAVICLNGTFAVPATLTYARDVTLLGITDAVLQRSGAANHGILAEGGSHTLTVQNLRFTGGRAGFQGGAIAGQLDPSLPPDTINVIDSTFDDNTGVVGGAIAGYTVNIVNSTFTDNTAQEAGGAVFSDNDGVTATSSTFESNVSSDEGGAIYGGGSATIDSSTFHANVAATYAGAVSASSVQVTNSTFVANLVTDAGGFGGTILTEAGGTVQQSTFLNNEIGVPTGGQDLWSGGSTLTLRGNVFAHDTELLQIAIDGGGVVDDQGGNLFTTRKTTETYFTAAAPSIDPSTKFGLTTESLLGSNLLADNGGPVQTVALPSDSVAIDAVPGTSTVTVDARGVGRAAPNDAGAYEYIAPAPTLPATGVDPGWLAGLAAALLAAGGLVLGVRRWMRLPTL